MFHSLEIKGELAKSHFNFPELKNTNNAFRFEERQMT